MILFKSKLYRRIEHELLSLRIDLTKSRERSATWDELRKFARSRHHLKIQIALLEKLLKS